MKQYKHLFFDLDRTLWDFEKNSIITLKTIFEKRDLHSIFPDFDTFVKTYKAHNERLWDLYKLRKIKKHELRNERFLLTLKDFGIDNPKLAEQIGDDYVELSPMQTILFPNTIEVLDYLRTKYKMHIITNGFVEVQYKKLKNCGLEKYFERVTTSEEAKASKPKAEIFQVALKSVNAKKTESLMIGDDLENDILGAKKFGIDQVFFNPNSEKHSENITFEIKNLKELMDLL